MTSEVFFNTVENHYQKNLPFVVYRKHQETKLTGLLQSDASVFSISDFTESGFVMSPFDNKSKTFYIPLTNSKFIETNDSINIKTNEPCVDKQEDLISKQNHLDLISKGISAIKQDKFEKVVLSRMEVISQKGINPLDIFKKLHTNYPSAFVYCWFHPETGLWIGATPETLLRIENNRLTTMSLAGTKTFKGTTSVNWDDKEIEEQKIVTDYIVENLENELTDLRISDIETVQAGNLLHLKTVISGYLKDKENSLEQIIRSLHPTPAVCGYPTQEAQKFILDNEGYDRKFYTGFLGELNFKIRKTRNSNKRNVENNAYSSVKKTTNLFVNLRCMQLQKSNTHIYVGGGITKDSIPEHEWVETVAKSDTIKKAL